MPGSFNCACSFIASAFCGERALGCLVISIGNLTVGGTGKTPVVEKFARALQVGGRRVAILKSRLQECGETFQTHLA
jgi:tetraacyldisaccharide 4'-kinase